VPPLRFAVFCIGDFRVDPALDEISREGVTTKLVPRTMQLLVCLAERAGQVVSVEQLLDVIWAELRSNPRLRDALEIERKRVAEQLVILERMRQAGEVPRRTSDNHARAASARKIEHPVRADEIAAASVH